MKKTRQITRAMNMVAAARLRTTQGKMENFEPYARKFSEVLENLASRIDPEIHPLLVRKEEVKKVELLHFSADRGLCGSFNSNTLLSSSADNMLSSNSFKSSVTYRSQLTNVCFLM